MSRFPARTKALALALLATLSGCANDETKAPAEAAGPYETLSEYGFFGADGAPAPGVVPYDVEAPLWADNALKRRYVVLPEGQKIAFGEREDWVFPRGTTIIKAFDYPLDMRDPLAAVKRLETRLMILGEGGWVSHTYVWNDAGTEAVRTVAGKRIEVAFIDKEGASATEDYLVPNTNQCSSCHERDDTLELLGVITPQLNRDVVIAGQTVSQLAWLADQGLFSAPLPPEASLESFVDPYAEGGDLTARARSYLHANCSHCHRPGGGGGVSGLVLLEWETDLGKLGVCKISAAAGAGAGGRPYDITPGEPDQSILPYRMSSVDPEIKMPELPNRIPDHAGVALIEAWISGMEPKGCTVE